MTPNGRKTSYWVALCGFLGLAATYLWLEHRAHLFGALPYVLLLACPILHFFMHRGHGAHHRGNPS